MGCTTCMKSVLLITCTHLDFVSSLRQLERGLLVVPPIIQGSTLQSPLVLATDLDGTFAGGSRSDRERLQQILAASSETTLIYITGRSVPAALALISEAGLPHPEVLIADVGTTIRHGPDLAPASALEAEIAEHWPGGDLVRTRLAGLDTIIEQEVRSPYRVSYSPVATAHLAAASHPPVELPGTVLEANATALAAARELLAELPVDVLGSAGIYLDVLPRGVNKGTTLRRVLRWLGHADDDVLVAGDSLNDLALFETGLAGVAVGNSEPELISRLAGRESVFLARGHGAAGILEALVHFGWLRAEEVIDVE